jgi:hypothetical protein
MKRHSESKGVSKGVGLENSLGVSLSFRFSILAVAAMLKISMVLYKNVCQSDGLYFKNRSKLHFDFICNRF